MPPAESETQLPERTASALIGGRYEYRRELGQGGAGRVLLVRDAASGELAALKIVAAAAEDQARIEFSLLSKIAHPNLARVLGLTRLEEAVPALRIARGTLAMISELAPGVAADRALRLLAAGAPPRAASISVAAKQVARAGPRDRQLAFAMRVLDRGARALAAVHAHGFVHGDVKPANLVVAEDGQGLKLIDLGFARAPGFEERPSGTPEFMAPELFRGELSPSADVYALGVTVWRLLAPPSAASAATSPAEWLASALADPALREPLPGWVPAPFAELLRSMRAADRARRPANGRELCDEVARLAEAVPELASESAGPAAESRSAKERAFAVSALPFVGNAEARRALDAALASAAVVAVVGPEGSGRSRLVRDAVFALQLERAKSGAPLPSYRLVRGVPARLTADPTVWHVLDADGVDPQDVEHFARAAEVESSPSVLVLERTREFANAVSASEAEEQAARPQDLDAGMREGKEQAARPQDLDAREVALARAAALPVQIVVQPLERDEVAQLLAAALGGKARLGAEIIEEAAAVSGGLAARLCRVLAAGLATGRDFAKVGAWRDVAHRSRAAVSDALSGGRVDDGAVQRASDESIARNRADAQGLSFPARAADDGPADESVEADRAATQTASSQSARDSRADGAATHSASQQTTARGATNASELPFPASSADGPADGGAGAAASAFSRAARLTGKDSLLHSSLPDSARAVAELLAVAGGSLSGERMLPAAQDEQQLAEALQLLCALGVATRASDGRLRLRPDVARELWSDLGEARRADIARTFTDGAVQSRSLKTATAAARAGESADTRAEAFLAHARGQVEEAGKLFATSAQRALSGGDPALANELAGEAAQVLGRQTTQLASLQAEALRAQASYADAEALLARWLRDDAPAGSNGAATNPRLARAAVATNLTLAAKAGGAQEVGGADAADGGEEPRAQNLDRPIAQLAITSDRDEPHASAEARERARVEERDRALGNAERAQGASASDVAGDSADGPLAQRALASARLASPELRSLRLLRAEVRRLRGDASGARADAQMLLDSDTKAANSAIALGASVLLARLSLDSGELGRAELEARRILDEAAEDPPGLRAAEVLSLVLLQRGDNAGAQAVLDPALAAARSRGERASEARLWSVQGSRQKLAGQLRAAAISFGRAFELADDAGEFHAAASFLVNLGTARLDAGELGTALDTLREGARRLARLGRDRDVGRTLYNLALARQLIGDYPDALRIAEHAEAAAARAGDHSGAAFASLLRAETTKERGEGDAARAQLAALPDLSALPAFERLAIESRAAALCAELGDEPTANAHLTRAEVAAETSGADDVELSLARAAWFGLKREPREAQREAERALARANERGEFAVHVLALSAAARAAEKRNDANLMRARLSELRSELDAAALTLSSADRARLREVRAYRAALAALPAAVVSRNGAPANAAALSGDDRFRRLAGIAKRLTAETHRRSLYELLLDSAIDLTYAESGFLMLRDAEGELRVRAGRTLGERDQAERGISQSIVARVLASGQALSTVDAIRDERLSGASSVHALALRSVLVVPLRSGSEILGVIYLDDRLRHFAFGDDEVALLTDLADLAAIAIEALERLRRERRAVRRLRATQTELARQVEAQAIELASWKGAKQLAGEHSGIVAHSARMRDTLELALRVARSDVPVLIRGESGTGKELIAKAIHAASARKDAPFVSENCGAIPESLLESTLFGHVKGAFTGADRRHHGLFEAAHGGTLFLDEIGEMSPSMQVRLLRVLQDGEVRPIGGERATKVDVRVLCATHRDVDAMLERGGFREDLYYRLAVVSLVLPSLRDRSDDILPLVQHFLAKYAPGRATKIDKRVLDRLVSQPWPGNVRQLENEVRRALALASNETLREEHFSVLTPRSNTEPASLDLRAHVDELERKLIKRALDSARGNQTRAAEMLGVSRFGLQKMLKRLFPPPADR